MENEAPLANASAIFSARFDGAKSAEAENSSHSSASLRSRFSAKADKNQNLVYVNFTPYENAGHILDFMCQNFKYVFLFSFDFHKLKNRMWTNKLTIFKRGTPIKKYRLYQLPVPESLVFPLLPIRSFLIFLQILVFLLWLKILYGKTNYYFTVNAFTAWIGNILRKLKIVEKTIFWVWDYYPPTHASKVILVMRKIYWQFDKIGTHSDHTVFLNHILQDLRKKIGILPKNINYPIVPIGTNPVEKIVGKKINTLVLGFIGVLKKSQGLDLFFDAARQIYQKYPKIKLEIIGSGPNTKWFKKRSKRIPLPCVFYGFVEKGKDIDKIMSNWHIGIATYIPEKSNVSYYGDPSKIKEYLSFGIPVITTDVFLFAKEIKNSNAGIVINYGNPTELVNAITKIKRRLSFFQKNALLLANKYNYKKIYRDLFPK